MLIFLSLLACTDKSGLNQDDNAYQQPVLPAASLNLEFILYGSDGCSASGSVATVSLSTSQGLAIITKIELNHQLDFGHDASLVWGSGRETVIWDNQAPLRPRWFEGRGEHEQVEISPGYPSSFVLTVGEGDCPVLDGQSTVVASVNYYDQGRKQNCSWPSGICQ